MDGRTRIGRAALALTVAAGAGFILGSVTAPADRQDRCADAVEVLSSTQDYQGWMRPCLGEEDSPAVAVILGDGGH